MKSGVFHTKCPLSHPASPGTLGTLRKQGAVFLLHTAGPVLLLVAKTIRISEMQTDKL